MMRALGLTPGLQARGCQVAICLEEHRDNVAAMAKLKGCEAHFYRGGTFLEEYLQKSRFAASYECDVIHICGLGWRNALLPWSSPAPMVMDHDELESALESCSFARSKAQWLLEWLSLFGYKNTVVVSEYLRELFKRRCGLFGLDRRTLLLPNASDSPKTNRSLPDRPTPSLNGRRPTILYMGGLYKNYGCLDIIGALRLLLTHRRDWRAILLGRGPEEQRIQELVRASELADHVDLPGYVTGERLADYLAAADVFVTPLYDTVVDWARCPGKTYTYMMYGRPIVTCKVGETFRALQAEGFYYEPENLGSMARAIGLALDVPRDWRPEYDCLEHTWDARAEVYLRWLRSWLPERGEMRRNVA
jgi:hypothetical protein